MSVNFATILAIAVSLAGIVLLATANAKRRRAFDLPQRYSRALQLLAWLLVAIPPLALLARQETTPLVLWIGALSAAGWIVAMRRPSKEFDHLTEALERRLEGSLTCARMVRRFDELGVTTADAVAGLANRLRYAGRLLARRIVNSK